MRQTIHAIYFLENLDVDEHQINWMHICLLIGVLVVWTAVFIQAGWGRLMHQPFFAVKSVSIEGAVNTAMALQAFAANNRGAGGDTSAFADAQAFLQKNNNLFTLDVKTLREAFEQEPWVRKAFVERDFSGKLHVRLEENDVVAWWGPQGSSRLLNRQGEVIDIPTFTPKEDNLPRLVGESQQAGDLLRMYRHLMDILQPLESSVDLLECTDLGRWRVQLANGATLELGEGQEQALLRAQKLASTLPQLLRQQGQGLDALEYVNMSYALGYALQLRGVPVSGTAAGAGRDSFISQHPERRSRRAAGRSTQDNQRG